MAEDEGWEWVQRPVHASHGYPPVDEDDDEHEGDGCGGLCNAATATPPLSHLHTNVTQFSDNLSSTASSPIFKHNLSAAVMANECIPHHFSEWIEPQLVFTKPHDYHFEGVEVYKVIAWLRNLPKSKDTLVSLLSDPNVCDAIMSNKAFQELACQYTDDVDTSLERRDSLSACNFSFGRKVYKLLREKLMEAIDVLVSLLRTHTFEKSALDGLDATTKSCILLVAVLMFFVIGKRSKEGL